MHNVLFGTAPGQKIIQLEDDLFTLAEAQEELPDLYQGNLEADPGFRDAEAGDFRLRPYSPCIDAGAPLTVARQAGTGRNVAVEDALYFCDGNGLIEGDLVTVGANDPARVLQVDYENNILRLDREISWQAGDPVNLPYTGAAPDIGPYEFEMGEMQIGCPDKA